MSAREVQRVKYTADGRSLRVEVLDDHLFHVELSARPLADEKQPIATSPMVGRTSYPGPSSFQRSADGLELVTSALKVSVDPKSLCLTAFDLARRVTLTRVCPLDLAQDWKGITLTREGTRNLYGLGQEYRKGGEMDGDWMGSVRHPGEEHGNRMVPFDGGWNGNTQMPVLYALGEGKHAYGFFLDNVYKQQWDFTQDPWRAQMWGDQIRFYLFSGSSLAQLRSTYMDLTGRPLVPPKKVFGLWVSEYGYRDWAEMEAKLKSLREHHFPVDGFMLDLFWFGGVTSDSDDSNMGKVTWDLTHFPDPKGELAKLAKEGVGVIPIEESYVARHLPEHEELARRGFLVRNARGEAAYLTHNGWWGRGGMIDWTNDAGADYWHEHKRLALVQDGVTGHWLDLGEPEMYPDDGRYAGGIEGDVHNIFNLKWIESVYRGYQRFTPDKRPFMVSRSGAAGMQRYGAGMWSGDIGSDLGNLAAHQNAQMHMSLSGIDYYGADIGGFHREALKGDLDELYTQWFAAGMMIDVPGRPHTENLCKCKETSPDRIGDVESNLANLRLRYRLLPYVYSLAHLAYESGQPVFPPPLYYFEDDLNLRTIGHEKMIGPWMLATMVARQGQVRADVYLPAGKWIDFHSGRWTNSRGQVMSRLPLYPHGSYQLPLFARAGSLIPMMFVDDKTMNVFGQRTDGSWRDELIVRVYPDAASSQFPLYEDDGESSAYLEGQVRRTWLSQVEREGTLTVTIAAAEGDYKGAPAERDNVLEVVPEQTAVASVSLNGALVAPAKDRAELDRKESGWLVEGRKIVVKSGRLPVSQEKKFEIKLGR